ncbi:hypothetical protein [Tenacibaculum haliotis]|uniref:hypothetical protein n=1 Tax=Tenacibaculum haliotis TaxID=1888914 RepID=UPI0021B001E0|nr:hypothetical protein [Tenacibaculum haliotis]MCT4699937.1 hypothetical protein [Tenacibaculum haliotis]
MFCLFSCSDFYPQMFENKIDKELERVKKNKVEIFYDNFEDKLKLLVDWELKELYKTRKQIFFLTKNLPEKDKLKIQFEKFNEWKHTISEKEIELDYWYLEKISEINEIYNCHDKNCFKKNLQIEGRFLKFVIRIVNENNDLVKEIGVIKTNVNKNLEYLSNTLNTASVFLMLTPEPAVSKGAVVIIEAVSVFVVLTNSKLNDYFEDIKEKLIKNFSNYYIQGFLINDKMNNLDILKNINK